MAEIQAAALCGYKKTAAPSGLGAEYIYSNGKYHWIPFYNGDGKAGDPLSASYDWSKQKVDKSSGTGYVLDGFSSKTYQKVTGPNFAQMLSDASSEGKLRNPCETTITYQSAEGEPISATEARKLDVQRHPELATGEDAEPASMYEYLALGIGSLLVVGLVWAVYSAVRVGKR